MFKRIQFVLGAAAAMVLAGAGSASASGGMNIFKLIPGVGHGGMPDYVAGAIFIVALVTVLTLLATRGLRTENPPLEPDKTLTLRNFFELYMEAVVNLMDDIIGPKSRRFAPLICALGVYILFSNCLGLVPGLIPPTSSLIVTASCGLTVFFATHIYGFADRGVGYLKDFTGHLEGALMIGMLPLMAPIELISHVARPLSLSLRLFGNMYGDHAVVDVFFGLVPYFVPIFPMLLGLLVCIIQMLVFILLSMVYFSIAVADDHHDHEEHGEESAHAHH